MTPTRPVLRWHGGKWMLAPWIIEHFPPHRIYTEAFGGAASVLLRKPRAHAEVYNDLDDDAVNLFRVLQNREQAARLQHLLEVTPFARAEFKLAYEPTTDPVERARRLIIIAFMGFGSNSHNHEVRTGFRANSNKGGNTPAHDWVNYAPALALIVARLRGVIIERRDAKDVIAQHDAVGALHYVDPPYVHSTRKMTGLSAGTHKVYKYEMTDDDHRALASLLQTVLGGVVLSGYPSPLYEELYAGWHRVERAALADGARRRTEVLWLNDAAWSVGARLI